MQNCTWRYLQFFISETLNLRSADWLPRSKRAKRYVCFNCSLKTLTSKTSPKYFSSMEHSVKACDIDFWFLGGSYLKLIRKLQTWTCLLTLPSVFLLCLMVTVMGKNFKEGIQLSGGCTKSLTEGGTRFLGKLLEVSLKATKVAANKKMIDLLSQLLSATDLLSICGEY